MLISRTRTGRAFRQDAAIDNEASRFSDRLGEQPTYRKVAAVRRICPAFEPAQGEHLQTDPKRSRIRSGLRPLLRATSPIDRNMMMVEIGSSTGSAASPKVPPTAPDVAASALCSRA